MKRFFLIFLFLAAFLFALPGMPLRSLDPEMASQAYASYSSGWNTEDDEGRNHQWSMISRHASDRGEDRDRGDLTQGFMRRVVDREGFPRELEIEEVLRDPFDNGAHVGGNHALSRERLLGQVHDGGKSWEQCDRDRRVYHSIAYDLRDDDCDRRSHKRKDHYEHRDKHHHDCDHHKVPEPSMLGLLGAGLAGLGLFRIAGRRKGV